MYQILLAQAEILGTLSLFLKHPNLKTISFLRIMTLLSQILLIPSNSFQKKLTVPIMMKSSKLIHLRCPL